MKIIINIILGLILFSPIANGQVKIRIQGGTLVPTGYLDDHASVGFSGNIDFSTNLFYSNIEISVSTGYNVMGYRTNLNDYSFNYVTVPALAGIRYNFTEINFVPYVGFEAGAYYCKYDVDFDYGIFGNHRTITEEVTYGVSPEAGFRMNISNLVDVDVTLKYHILRTKYVGRSFLGLQTGFSLRL